MCDGMIIRSTDIGRTGSSSGSTTRSSDTIETRKRYIIKGIGRRCGCCGGGGWMMMMMMMWSGTIRTHNTDVVGRYR